YNKNRIVLQEGDAELQELELPQEIIDKIEYYTVVRQLGAGQQYDLLTKEFPEFQIHCKNIYNAMQKFHRSKNYDENDVAKLLQKLFKECEADPDLFIYAILKVFKASIQSTQQVECLNNVLKKHLNQGTLLTELVDVIQKELEKEASYTRIRDYYRLNPSVYLPSTYNIIFKSIDQVLQMLLFPIPLSLQYAQMKQSLLYVAILVDLNKIHNIEYDCDDFIEYDDKVSQIRINQLLDSILSEHI
ncbi:7504_t:CDS:2, partial [Racocetra fulgida]